LTDADRRPAEVPDAPVSARRLSTLADVAAMVEAQMKRQGTTSR
jgi:hypothetical protein